MAKLFPGKVCIYLDQFAVSGLAEGGAWKELSALIQEGTVKERIVVLYSVEHVFETCKRDYERALAADRMLFWLSGGISINPEPHVSARLLIGAIRKWPIRYTSYCAKKHVNDLEDYREYERLKSFRGRWDERVEEGAEFVNAIRAKFNGKSSETILAGFKALIVKNYEDELIKKFRYYSAYGFTNPTSIALGFADIPHWADGILEIAMGTYGLNRKEAKKAEELLKRKGLKAVIPNLYTRACLEAAMTVKQQKENANDHLDVMRLSTAIPLVDVILTDKSKVHDIRLMALDKEFKVQAIPGTPQGMKEIITAVRGAINAL